MTVSILLSTYNGERYLAAQLDSILAQYYANWQLLIRDDGSADSTLQIIKRYQQKDARIHLIEGSQDNLGAMQSYAELIAIAPESEIYMFCDQDDVWLPDKIKMAVAAINAYSVGMPVLTFCDAEVCDENLKIDRPSLMQWQGINSTIDYFQTLVCGNFIPGATMAVNHDLFKCVQSRPAAVEEYDYGLALQAAISGKIIFLNQAGLKYRRHANTVTQVARLSLKYHWSRRNVKFERMLMVARNLLAQITELTAEQREYLQAILKLPAQNIFQRLYFCCRYQCLPSNIVKKLWYLFWITFGK